MFHLLYIIQALKAREEVRQKESSTINLSNNKEQKQKPTSNLNNNNNNNKPTNTYENFKLPDSSSSSIDKKDSGLDAKSTTADDKNDADMNMYERQDSTDDEKEEVYQNFSVINSHYNKKNSSKNTSPRDSTIMSFSNTTIASNDDNDTITTTTTTTKPQLNSFSQFSSPFLSKTMSVDASSSNSRNVEDSAMPQLSSFSSNVTSSTSTAKNKSVTLPNKKASSFTPRDTDAVDSNKHKPKFYSLRPPKKPPRLSVLDAPSTEKSDENDDDEKNKDNLGPACRMENSKNCTENSVVNNHNFLHFN